MILRIHLARGTDGGDDVSRSKSRKSRDGGGSIFFKPSLNFVLALTDRSLVEIYEVKSNLKHAEELKAELLA